MNFYDFARINNDTLMIGLYRHDACVTGRGGPVTLQILIDVKGV